MIALWDFERKPWTWDFYTWLVIVREAGATGVDFRLRNAVSTKWPMREAIKRFWNYLEPGPRELAGMTVMIEGDGVETGLGYGMTGLPLQFERLQLREKANIQTFDYTVTIRSQKHRPQRNSDEKVWRAFARRIGARVIEDSRVQPISLRERFTLYANAKMNYGVQNGPISAIWYTAYPMCMVSDPTCAIANKTWGGHQIKPGQRMRWLLPNQHLIWERATVDGLLKTHEQIAC
jgi:hypothetical protein